MTDRRFDIVVYGASGFTGAYVIEQFYSSEAAQKYKIAIAGRNKNKLETTLKEVSELIGKNISNTPIIIADSSNPSQLDEMAKQTRLIINVVGPYRLYGEAVVKAAVENGTSHVDISGEPAWLEKMQLLYDEKAKKTGSYIIGACGWDSIPVDLGISFLTKSFPGTVAYAETFAKLSVPRGYAGNNGTFQTLLLALSSPESLSEIRRKIMPEKLNKIKAPTRPLVWYNDELQSYVIPFPGADRSIVDRSQYYEATIKKQHPVSVKTYIFNHGVILSWFTLLWFALLAVACKIRPILRFCQNNPDIASFGTFSSVGPKRELLKKSSFTTFIKGYGWKNSSEPKSDKEPDHTLIIRVDGPDAGYIATSAFALSSALTVLEDKLPETGGVYTTAVAFDNTNILDRLATFNITFKVDSSSDEKKRN